MAQGDNPLLFSYQAAASEYLMYVVSDHQYLKTTDTWIQTAAHRNLTACENLVHDAYDASWSNTE